MSNKKLLAISFALITCLIWSGNFIVARGVHDWIPPITLSFWRWFVAFLILLPIGIKRVRQEWSLIKQHLLYLSLMAVTGISLFNTLIYYAGHYTRANNLTIIMSTAPILTILFSCVFKVEKFSKAKTFGAMLALTGALFVVTKGDLASLGSVVFNSGDTLVSMSALIWGGWNVALTLKPKGISALSFLVITVSLGLLALTPFYIYELLAVKSVAFDLNTLGVFLYIGALASVLAWFLWQKAIETLGPVKANLIYYSVPIFAAVLAYFILGESLESYHYLAFILVFAGVITSNFSKIGALPQEN